LQALVRSPPLRRAARSVRRAARYIRERTRRCEGLPGGLDFDTLDALCREHGRRGLKRCVHVRLSVWKPRGAYRLELLTEAGTRWSLIFKDECYWSALLIPMLEGLPASPGPPEAVVYRMQHPFLSPFLPDLFWFREIEPGRHFQYLLEDLSGTYAELRPGTPHHLKARGLVQIHQALNKTLADHPPDALIRYDSRYSERLLECAAGNLAAYRTLTADATVETLMHRWGEVTSLHQRDEFHEDGLRAPIHGDFVMRNLLAHRHDHHQLKVLDWEWAGIGLPHADLAALAMSLPREHRAALVQAYVEEDRRLEAEQHWRLFHWCQLQRALFDATRLARKQLASPRRLPLLRRATRRSAAVALDAIDRLSTGQGSGKVGLGITARSTGPIQKGGTAGARSRPGDGAHSRDLRSHGAEVLRLLATRSARLRRVARYVRGRSRPSEGLPRGLEFEILDGLCQEHGRGRLRRCVHSRLSGWKSRGTFGTYRLELLTESGTSWRLIFKDECYRPEFAPALQGLPVSPGPPEAIVYQMRDSTLSPFLPRLFWLRELEPGRHFQYLLEDLAGAYAELPRGAVYSMKAARALGLLQVQQALRKTFVGEYPDGLIRYDRSYSERLFEYAGRNLADYLALTADIAVATLRDRWHEVGSVHQLDEFYDDDLRVPIHGDFAIHNVLAHRHDESRLKVLDWEWAGIRLPHADLAALIKYVRKEDQPALLQAFMEQHPGLDAERHRRLLDWCQLERWLFNAAFLAKQQLLSERRVPWLTNKISDSAGAVLVAAQRLGASQTRTAA
jgi:thiamine kinase-like enzyme